MDYWQERALNTQERLTKKSIKQVEAQLRKYYKQVSKTSIARFLLTYNKLQNSMEAGLQPTPADLYKLDKYWEIQAEMTKLLRELGDKEVKLYGNSFSKVFKNIYESLALKDDTNFNYIDEAQVEQMIKQIWCADGKSWSDRVWNNTEKLQQALNDGLLECVLTGASPEQLKERLMYEFNVGYNRADSIVRTEISHIQTQAAKQRYEDAGIDKVMVWADEDERRCDICGKLHEKVFPAFGKMPIPAHPRCRCRIIPYFD